MKIKPYKLRIEFYRDLEESSMGIMVDSIDIFTDKFTLRIPITDEMKKVINLQISEKAKKVELAEIIYRDFNNEYTE